MNPFQKHISASLEADVNINIDVNEASAEQVGDVPLEAPDIAVEETLPSDEEVVQQEEVAGTVADSVASLESIYQTLAQVSQERDTLTDAEVSFMHIALGGVAGRMGGKATDLVPSLESDNYFERNSVTASMESVGSAFKAGVTAAGAAIKTLIKKIYEWFGKVKESSMHKARALKQLARGIVKNELYIISHHSDGPFDPMEALKSLEQRFDKLEADKDFDYVGSMKKDRGVISDNQLGAYRFKGAYVYNLVVKLAQVQEKIGKSTFLDRLNVYERKVLSSADQRHTEEYNSRARDSLNGQSLQEWFVESVQETRNEYHAIVKAVNSFKVERFFLEAESK